MAAALTLFEARARVLQACRGAAVTVETVPLASAHGRVLARSIVADSVWPSTDRAAMDGFAVLASSAGLPPGTTLPVVGESLAGHPFTGTLGPGTAIRIMTGAVVPPGADAVVAVEHTSGFGGSSVELRAAVRAGQHVRPVGSELQPGSEVLAAGTRLRGAEIGVLAVLGCVSVPVAKAPRVAIVATGDEVVPVEQAPLPHQVRESNSWALAAQVAECGGIADRLGIAPDEPAGLRALLARGLERADVLLTIGGVSAGSHDLVHGTLGQLGVQQDFHGLDLKPGKPTFFGISAGPQRRYVFGLPGNPASTFTVFDLLVRPLLLALQGVPPGDWLAELPVAGANWQLNARLQAMPATVRGVAGCLVAELAPGSPSGDPFRLVAGNAYALVPGNARPGDLRSLRVVGRSSGVELP